MTLASSLARAPAPFTAAAGYTKHSRRVPASQIVRHQRSRSSTVHRRSKLQLRAQQTATRSTPPGLSTMPWDNSPEQQQASAQLESRVQAECPHGSPDRETQQWFLRDRKLDVDAALEKLNAMMKWRQEFIGDRRITAEEVAAEAETGKAYLHTHPDVNSRPVIIVRVKNHVSGASPLDDSKRLCVHLIEEALSRLPPEGETILGVFDLRGFGHRNTDLGFVRFLVDIFFTYYPKRLGQVLFVDAPWIFQPGWEMVKPWLKKYAALVRFVSVQQLRDEFFTPDTVPEDFQ